jgi:hypothetical protein
METATSRLLKAGTSLRTPNGQWINTKRKGFLRAATQASRSRSSDQPTIADQFARGSPR